MAGGNSGKIKLFKFILKTYQDIGLRPPQSNQFGNRINLTIWLNLFCLIQFFASTTAYLVFEANSMIEYGMISYTCASAVLCFILYLISFWQMKNILSYIENCERFIGKRTYSTNLYEDASEIIERLTKFFAYALSGSASFFMLPPLFYAIVSYYVLGAGKESFFLFYPTWMPFDWKTPFGYLVAWIGQSAGVAAVAGNIITVFGTIFGSSWLFIVIVKDITSDMDAFNDIVKTVKKNRGDQAELMEDFCDIMLLYFDAKQCVTDFSPVCEYSLFAIFSWNILCVSSLLVALQFQLWEDNSKLFEIVVLSIAILWVFGFNLVICEPGQRVADQFEQFDEELGRCDWNKLPLKLQRMYLIFLSDTQQPKNIRSYGRIMCTRDTFKKIANKGFSYFMTLRNFRAF